MIKIENQCCECATEGYPCNGSICPNRRVKVLICDSCKQEVGKLYRFDGGEYCADCVLGTFEIIDRLD